MLGAPGAGKGTQARLVTERLGIPLISSGDLFRRHEELGTDLGHEARQYTEKGVLVPDDITTVMVLEELFSTDSGNGFVLDGFPRNMYQVQCLDEALSKKGLQVDLSILIETSEEERLSRLGKRLVCANCQASYHTIKNPPKEANLCDKCGQPMSRRTDDEPDVIALRFKVYEEDTEPVIGFLENLGKLVRIDGTGSIEEVQRRIDASIDNLGNNEAF